MDIHPEPVLVDQVQATPDQVQVLPILHHLEDIAVVAHHLAHPEEVHRIQEVVAAVAEAVHIALVQVAVADRLLVHLIQVEVLLPDHLEEVAAAVAAEADQDLLVGHLQVDPDQEEVDNFRIFKQKKES